MNHLPYFFFSIRMSKVKQSNISIINDSVIIVHPPRNSKSSMMLLHLKEQLLKVVIQVWTIRILIIYLLTWKWFLIVLCLKGLPTVSRAVINVKEKKKTDEYYLVVEGENMREVMATYGVNGTTVTSNNVLEVFRTLGVEAAKYIFKILLIF